MAELNPVETKAPSEIKYYTMDWSGELNSGATISTTAWVLSSTEITNVTDAIVTGSLKTTIKVSGGKDGQTYYLTNTVTTSDGETLEETGALQVKKGGLTA